MKHLQVTIESNIPVSFFQVINSIGFWNKQGRKIYESNRNGTMGSSFTQEQAKKESYETFVFTNLLTDIQTLLEKTEFKFGKAGSHIWISNEKNERLLMIYF